MFNCNIPKEWVSRPYHPTTCLYGAGSSGSVPQGWYKVLKYIKVAENEMFNNPIGGVSGWKK